MKHQLQQKIQQEYKTATTTQPTMQNLLNTILVLGQKFENLESELNVAKNMRMELSNKIDKPHQYQWKTCIAYDSINRNRNENQVKIMKKTKNVLTCNTKFFKKEEIK